jgi:hypothetical protein
MTQPKFNNNNLWINKKTIITSIISFILIGILAYFSNSVVLSSDFNILKKQVEDNHEAVKKVAESLDKFIQISIKKEGEIKEVLNGHTLEISELRGDFKSLTKEVTIKFEYIQDSVKEIKELIKQRP